MIKIILLGLLTLASSVAFATGNQIECQYKIPVNNEQVSTSTLFPNTTSASVIFDNSISTLVHNLNFDIPSYVQKVVEKKSIKNGLFYGLSRYDDSNIRVMAVVGKIEAGVILEVQQAQWDFGTTDSSVIVNDTQELGNLSCKVVTDL